MTTNGTTKPTDWTAKPSAEDVFEINNLYTHSGLFKNMKTTNMKIANGYDGHSAIFITNNPVSILTSPGLTSPGLTSPGPAPANPQFIDEVRQMIPRMTKADLLGIVWGAIRSEHDDYQYLIGTPAGYGHIDAWADRDARTIVLRVQGVVVGVIDEFDFRLTVSEMTDEERAMAKAAAAWESEKASFDRKMQELLT